MEGFGKAVGRRLPLAETALCMLDYVGQEEFLQTVFDFSRYVLSRCRLADRGSLAHGWTTIVLVPGSVRRSGSGATHPVRGLRRGAGD